MADAIDRAQLRRKLMNMQQRIRQRRDGAYRCGYDDACRDALMNLNGCDQLETTAVTRCKNCRHSTEKESSMVYCMRHNRSKKPDDFCNYGDPEYEFE